MASCEKCWGDSYTYTYGTPESRIECYQRLVRERDCTPEEQAGTDAGICPKCKKKTVHQITGDCMNCGLTKEQVYKIQNYIHNIVDEGGNKWEVIEVSDLHDIINDIIE